MPFRILGGFKGTLFVLFRSWDLIVHFLSCINYLLLNPKNSKLYPLKYISRMTIHKLVSKFCRTTALSSHKSWDISTIFKGGEAVFKSMAFSFKFWGISFIWSSINLFMGTLKSVCSSWFALISRDKYEHTHLRVPIHNCNHKKKYQNFHKWNLSRWIWHKIVAILAKNFHY